MRKNYITLSRALGIIIILLICLLTFKKIFLQNPKAIAVMTVEVLENRGNELITSSTSESYRKHSVSFIKNEEAVFDKDGNKISISDIPEGSIVRIEYDGRILELGYESPIIGTIKIEIIETAASSF